MQTKKLTQIQKTLLFKVPDWSFFTAVAALVMVALFVFWQKQQENVDSFDRQLTELSQKIDSLPIATVSKKQLTQQLVTIQRQIDSLPLANVSKEKNQQFRTQVNQQITALKQQVNSLPDSFEKEQLSLYKDRLTLKKDQVNSQNAIYVSLIQGLGSLFFLITAYFAWRNVKIAEDNLKVTQQKQESDRINAEANLKATEEKQVTERFSKAIELLGHQDLLEVRLGGIYALERIAKDSPKDYWTIMEVLTAFVREKSHTIQAHGCDVPDAFENDDHENWYIDSLEKENYLRIATDIQAVLTILSRRDKAYCNGEKDRLDLTGVNFSWLIFPATVGFKAMNLATANLRRAVFDEVDLTEAQLTGAYLTEARLKKTILTSANLVEACLARAILTGANLQDTDLRGADLARADLEQADLRKANLQGAYLGGVRFAETDLRGTDLRGAIFWQGTLPKEMSIDKVAALISVGQFPAALQRKMQG